MRPNATRVVRRMRAYQRVSFVRIDFDLPSILLVLHDVPDAADGVEELFLEPVVDLRAEMIDVDVDDVRAGVEIVIPDVLGDERAGEDPVDVPHEVLEEGVLLPGELDLLLATARLVRDGVELEV